MKHAINLLLVSAFLVKALSVSAQEGSDYIRKSVYLELLGNGLAYSVNYDMRFKKNQQDGLGFRIGAGGFSITGYDSDGVEVKGSLLTFPIELNYLIGKKRSALETGIGVSPLFLGAKIEVDDEKIGGTGSGANVFLNLGYRFQPLKKGFTARINWTPIINSGGFIPAWFGISLGYSFR